MKGEPITDEWIAALSSLPHDVVILPEAVDGDTGVYRDETLMFAKSLRAVGVDAGYLHDEPNRTWAGRLGEPILIPVVIALATGVVTSVIGTAVCGWLAKTFGAQDVAVRVVRVSSDGARTLFEARGPADHVADLLAQVQDEPDDSNR